MQSLMRRQGDLTAHARTTPKMGQASQRLSASNIFDVSGKVALVTGGSSGIGLMIAQTLVHNGAKVYISSRKKHVCDKVAAELTKEGPGQCISLPANLVSDDECKKLAAEIAAREPKLHILINNAGATWGSTIEEHPESAWLKIFGLNVFSIFHLTRALLPQLEAATTSDDWSRVINIGSIAGFTTTRFDNAPAYAASKASVIHLSRYLAVQFAERQIAVNCIAPGVFPSKMATYLTEDARRDATLSTIPMGRFGTDVDMAGLTLYLCSKASGFATGVVIPLDGGYSATSRL